MSKRASSYILAMEHHTHHNLTRNKQHQLLQLLQLQLRHRPSEEHTTNYNTRTN